MIPMIFSNFRRFRVFRHQVSVFILLTTSILLLAGFLVTSDHHWQVQREFYLTLPNSLSTNRNSTRSTVSANISPSLDVVLSYYSEDLDYVARYISYLKNVSNFKASNLRFILYNKNEKIQKTRLLDHLNVDLVENLPNLGREGATYLYHIIQNYDALADHTIFSQAGVEGVSNTGLEDWFLDRLENQFNQSVGFMPLVNNNLVQIFLCNAYRTGHFSRIIELWVMLEQSFCPLTGHAVAYRGQFLVSRARIRQRKLSVYKYLYEMITANSSHWIHRDLQSIFYKSTPDKPIFGHVLERAWTIIFQCAQIDLPKQCRQRQCACFDSI